MTLLHRVAPYVAPAVLAVTAISGAYAQQNPQAETTQETNVDAYVQEFAEQVLAENESLEDAVEAFQQGLSEVDVRENSLTRNILKILPSPITPGGEDFFMYPEEQVGAYVSVYGGLTRDGELNYDEIGALNVVAGEILSESEAKVFERFGTSWEEMPGGVNFSTYRNNLTRLSNDVQAYGIHLDVLEGWRMQHNYDVEFFGSPPFSYIDGDRSAGWVWSTLRSNTLLADYRFPEILSIPEEFPLAGTRLSAGMSLLLGALPFGYSLANTIWRSRKRKVEDSEVEVTIVQGVAGFLGFVGMDAVHPAVFPARVLGGLGIEALRSTVYAGQAVYNRRSGKTHANSAPSSPGSDPESPETESSTEESEQELAPLSKPEQPSVDAWGFKVPRIGDKE